MSQDRKNAIIEYLKSSYQAHTIILYGSNTAMLPEHDLDLLVLTDHVRESKRDWSQVAGMELDAYIRSNWAEEDVRGLIRFRQGHLLLDERGEGLRVIQAAQEAFAKGIPQQSAEDYALKKNWVNKTLQRLNEHSLRVEIRKNELFSLLLQQYFQNQAWWYEGASIASQRMQKEDPQAYQIFLSGDFLAIADLVFGKR